MSSEIRLLMICGCVGFRPPYPYREREPEIPFPFPTGVAFPGTRRELNGNSGTRSADPMTSHRSPTSRTPDADQVEGATP